MSLSGNNHSSGNSGSRTSIFETFHTPSFGDDNFDVQPQSVITQPIKTYSRQPILAQGALTVNKQSGSASSLQSLSREEEAKAEEEEIFDEEEEEELSSSENAETTLWMSCSPGRDFTDEEEEEEEEVVPSQEEEEDEENEMEDESSDDGLPLSKLAGKRFLEKGLKPPSAKRIKAAKKSKLPKDKKAPKKPLSAYAFFYRDTQMAIKSQNPQATFGEISKIVASMWDRLDGELKEDYNRRAEENKKDYIQQLAEYCALNKDKILPSAKSKQKKSKKSSSSKPKRKSLESDSHSESQDGVVVESEPKDETDNLETSQRSSESSERMASPKQDEKQDKPRAICNYTKCQNPAIDDPRWEKNYCSSECVIMHCKDVFNAWVANRKSAYCET